MSNSQWSKIDFQQFANEFSDDILINNAPTILYSKKDKAIEFIKREKYLFIFLAWCFLTILWSEHSVVSFKRFIQYLTTVTIPLSYFLYSKTNNKSNGE